MLTMTPTQCVYLGPAQVGAAAGDRLQLVFPDQKVWARMALAFPYQAAADDTVLAISQDDSWYVIGVLEGAGKTAFVAPGDLEFRAPKGRIEMTAANGIRLRGPAVTIVADKLNLIAKTASERFDSARRWVKGLFDLRAGSARTRVEETHRLTAGRIVERAREDVKIDGRKIHLG